MKRKVVFLPGSVHFHVSWWKSSVIVISPTAESFEVSAQIGSRVGAARGKVPRGFHQGSTACCWGYHLSLLCVFVVFFLKKKQLPPWEKHIFSLWIWAKNCPLPLARETAAAPPPVASAPRGANFPRAPPAAPSIRPSIGRARVPSLGIIGGRVEQSMALVTWKNSHLNQCHRSLIRLT